MTITVIPETRTDPKDVITLADGYEQVEALVDAIMDGADTIPGTVMLMDQNDELHSVIVDWTDNSQREAVEILTQVVDEDQWDDIRPVIEALFEMPKKWLQTDHEVEVV